MRILRLPPAIACLFLVGCEPPPPEGQILEVVAIAGAKPLFVGPTEALVVSRSTTWVLDRPASTVVSVRADGSVDSVARAGRGPGELVDPATMRQIGDRVAVVDAGRGRILYYDLEGEFVESVGGVPPRRRLYLEPDGERLLALDYAVNFRVRERHAVPGGDSLVEVIDLNSGPSVRAEAGSLVAPRRYPGHVAPVLANTVRVARSPTDGSLWIAWRFDEDLAVYRDGRVQRFAPRLGFKAPAWRERAMRGRGVFRAQPLTFDLDVRADGHVIVLGAAERNPAKGSEGEWPRRGGGSPGAPQALDILTAKGAVVCRIRLPIKATSVRVVGSDEVVLTDAGWSAAVHRVRYRCPRHEDEAGL